MDISSRFSLADFLAYLFPGIFGTMGLFLLLMLTPLRPTLITLPTDLTAGILFLAFSYILGVILSGFVEMVTKRSANTISLSGFEEEVKKAFKVVFGIKTLNEWTRAHFYLCRSLVVECMPNASQTIQRQSGLRQLRMNMLPSSLIWLFTGLLWGGSMVKTALQPWGIGLIILSLGLWLFFFRMTRDRMRSNDQRETRETLSAFLAGYKAGLFKKQNKPASNH